MPVYQDAVVFLGVAITLGFFLVLGAVATVLSRRNLRRRLAALAARVSDDGERSRGLAATLDRLEQLTEARTIRVEVPVEVPVRVEVPVEVPVASVPRHAGSPLDAAHAADRLRLTLGELPVGIVVCDEDGKVVYRNPAAAKQVWPRASDGRINSNGSANSSGSANANGSANSNGSANGNGGRAAAPGRTDPRLAEGLSAVLEEALEGRRLSRPVELDGSPRRVLRLTAVPLDDGPRLVGAMVVVEDVSEEQGDSIARRDVLASLGRELVEPVVAMAVLADGLASEEDPTIRRRLADRARAESTRARRMVDDLIELGRMASQTPGERELVRLAPVAMQAAASVDALAQQRLVEVRLLDIPTDAAALGERRQIELAMTKLLEHAVETARAGAKLEVHVGPPGLDGDALSQSASWLDIEVIDACPSTAATRAPGLTFAIVEQAARNLGGSATFLSTPDLTTSIVRLPASDPAAARRQQPAAETPPGATPAVAATAA